MTTVRKGNHLFRNSGHGRFEDVTKESGLNYGHSSGALFDFDGTGFSICSFAMSVHDRKTGGVLCRS